MSAGAKQACEAYQAAERRLQPPAGQKQAEQNASAVLVRLDWPGVLAVFDPDTGEIVAVPDPRHSDRQIASFVLPLPAQFRPRPGRTVQ